MKAKVITLLLLSILSTSAFSNQFKFDGNPIQQHLNEEEGVFGFAYPIMVPIFKTGKTYTFHVDRLTPEGKQSDALTLSCNNGVFKIYAGQSGVCNLSERFGFAGVEKSDFKNGSYGTITLT